MNYYQNWAQVDSNKFIYPFTINESSVWYIHIVQCYNNHTDGCVCSGVCTYIMQPRALTLRLIEMSLKTRFVFHAHATDLHQFWSTTSSLQTDCQNKYVHSKPFYVRLHYMCCNRTYKNPCGYIYPVPCAYKWQHFSSHTCLSHDWQNGPIIQTIATRHLHICISNVTFKNTVDFNKKIDERKSVITTIYTFTKCAIIYLHFNTHFIGNTRISQWYSNPSSGGRNQAFVFREPGLFLNITELLGLSNRYVINIAEIVVGRLC